MVLSRVGTLEVWLRSNLADVSKKIHLGRFAILDRTILEVSLSLLGNLKDHLVLIEDLLLIRHVMRVLVESLVVSKMNLGMITKSIVELAVL